MYEKYYGFREKPFTLLPDPDFLYLGKNHRAAMTLLEYGLVSQAGFVVISGGVGTGKTTLIRHLLNQIEQDVTVGLIANTHVSFGNLIERILMAFGLDYIGKGQTQQFEAFTDFMVAEYTKNQRIVLIIDEAQNLSLTTLEELRMLSNINADKVQVLHIILVGQNQLLEKLRRPELEQFVQRVAVDYHLEPLSENETKQYIRYRLTAAGSDNANIFSEKACELIFKNTDGIPRLINVLCDRLLVYGFSDEQETIDVELVNEVIDERGKSRLLRKDSNKDDYSSAGNPHQHGGKMTFEIDRDTARELFSTLGKE